MEADKVKLVFKAYPRYDLKEDGLITPIFAVQLELEKYIGWHSVFTSRRWTDPVTKAKIAVVQPSHDYALLKIMGSWDSVIAFFKRLRERGLKVRLNGFDTRYIYALIVRSEPPGAWYDLTDYI